MKVLMWIFGVIICLIMSPILYLYLNGLKLCNLLTEEDITELVRIKQDIEQSKDNELIKRLFIGIINSVI